MTSGRDAKEIGHPITGSNTLWTKAIVLLVVALAIAASAAAQRRKGGSAAPNPQQAASRSPDLQEPEANPSLPTNTSPPENETAGARDRSIEKHILSDFEFWLSAEILVFGFGVLLAEFLLLRKATVTAEEALRVYAVSLIVIGTLFAITAGFDANQIAPAMGLFGTIAGYLLGKRTGDRPVSRSKGGQDDHEDS